MKPSLFLLVGLLGTGMSLSAASSSSTSCSLNGQTITNPYNCSLAADTVSVSASNILGGGGGVSGNSFTLSDLSQSQIGWGAGGSVPSNPAASTSLSDTYQFKSTNTDRFDVTLGILAYTTTSGTSQANGSMTVTIGGQTYGNDLTCSGNQGCNYSFTLSNLQLLDVIVNGSSSISAQDGGISSFNGSVNLTLLQFDGGGAPINISETPEPSTFGIGLVALGLFATMFRKCKRRQA